MVNERVKLKSRELNIERQPEETTRLRHTSTQSRHPNKETEIEYENIRPSITGDVVHDMSLVQNDQVPRMLAISLALIMEKIRDAAGSDTVNEFANILHLRSSVSICSRKF